MKKNSGVYKIISCEIREKILSGELNPLEKFPSERKLCEQFGISRVTMRKVLDILEGERLIHRRQGSGTYVSPNPTRRIPLLIDYTGSMQEHAPELHRTVLVWRWEEAEDVIAERLDIPAGDKILYSERIDSLSENPVAWDQVYIPGSFAYKLTENKLSRIDFFESWTKSCNFNVESCRQFIEAVSASSEISRNLKIAARHAVLKSTEIYYTLHKRPAGLFISYYHPEYITIASHFIWSNHEKRN